MLALAKLTALTGAAAAAAAVLSLTGLLPVSRPVQVATLTILACAYQVIALCLAGFARVLGRVIAVHQAAEEHQPAPPR